MATHGLHHVTAIAGEAQRNVDFYVGVLGLRLVKRTVNFDDPSSYHLYYGDGLGRPGTAVTFFAWDHRQKKGRPGTGQVTAIGLSVAEGALAFWQRRLAGAGVSAEGPLERFDGESFLRLQDPDGLVLELVGTSGDPRPGWASAAVPAPNAVRGLHSVALSVADTAPTAALMAERLGFGVVASEAGRTRLQAGEGGTGCLVDLLGEPAGMKGRTGIGTNHHVAWRIADEAAEAALRATLAGDGYDVTEILDRNYFRSIYFEEPGGVLFEVATDAPGFDVDETAEALGSQLRLPAELEPRRAEIEAGLPPLTDPSR